MAQATYSGSRCLAASLLSTYLILWQTKRVHIHGVLTNLCYDETPLTVRCKTPNKTGPEEEQKTKLQSAGMVGKLLCIDFEVAILTQKVDRPQRWQCSVMPIPCPVQILDRGTGEVLRHCIDAVTRIPVLHDVCCVPDVFAADISCCDRASANGRCGDGLYAGAAARTKRLRMPCFAHTASTSQGRVYAVVSLDFTGLIAMSLAQSGTGSDDAFRKCIVEVLLRACYLWLMRTHFLITMWQLRI